MERATERVGVVGSDIVTADCHADGASNCTADTELVYSGVW